MDQLTIAQTKPVFTVYPDNTQRKFTQYDLSTPTEQVHSPNFSCFEQTNLPNPTLNNSFISSSTSEDSLLNDDLIISSSSQKKFSNYCKNKETFYANAALHIGGKTSAQVRGKIQNLIKKYSEEKKEETGKGTSKWAYFYLMNEIFGNRENVRPESLIDSTGKWNEEHAEIEREKLKFDKEKFQAQIKLEQERIELEKFKENGKIELEKFKY
ncbi:2940_t:CDS:2 [Gigaspora rosea]|nr:2940_t:CDS:2 [Gigaspora rosea]